MKRIALTLAFAALSAAPAFAHPGHGLDDGFSLRHYLTSPEHMGLALIAVLVVAGLYVMARRRAR